MEAVQREIKSLSCEGLAASGALKVEMNGDFKVTDISIDESLFSDKEMLEDLIAAAVNDANRQVEQTTQERMSGMLPPGMKMPF